MKRFNRIVYIALVGCLLMVQNTFADRYRHSPTGMTFPDHMAKLEKEQITNYEEKHPGFGVSIGYNGPGITVTVFVYTMGMDTIPTDLNSSVIKNHFKQVKNDIVKAEKMGSYSEVEMISEGVVTWGDTGANVNSLLASFSYKQKNRKRLSYLYLMGFRDHFLKIRFTYNVEMQKEAEKVQEDFLREISSMLQNITKDSRNQGMQMRSNPSKS
ncbi:MAG: hypothetical protein HF981_19540 [Desulfobacteraceae bacterium]|nr:hypothetical protein [Desulfobacteraceae bacterium]MBC2752595.1 hypothetical protein [Desulfobacteraceae bacterium]